MDELFSSRRLISRRHNPELGNQLDHLRRRGRVKAVCPGVFISSEEPEDFLLRAQAVATWRPGVRFIGATAARLSWWRDLSDDRILVDGRIRLGLDWLRGAQRDLPHELFMPLGDAWVARPAFSVLDMIAEDNANAVCEALRRGAATLASMHDALRFIPRARGNRLRRQILHESRDEPWSPLERRAHAALRAAGIKGWQTNHRVVIHGRAYYLDVAFPSARLAVEIDGYAHHGDAAAFVADRRRHNDLVLDGWTVLHFTHQSLDTLVPILRRM